MASGVALMGRPRKSARKSAAAPVASAAVMHLKGSPAYGEWLEGLHRTTHLQKTTIVRLALAEWAERHGHPAPPEF
jgi:hypothetical protein